MYTLLGILLHHQNNQHPRSRIKMTQTELHHASRIWFPANDLRVVRACMHCVGQGAYIYISALVWAIMAVQTSPRAGQRAGYGADVTAV